MALRYTIRQLEYFVAVGEHGSIAAASEKLNVSSPSISAAISQLEQEIGISLFVRKHAQGLALTKAGHRLLEQARKALREVEMLGSMAGDISDNVQGPMSIGCLLTFAQMVLPKVRRSFESSYPLVQVTQHELNQIEIFSQLRRAELDVALTYNLDIPGDLTFLPLVDLPPHVLMAQNHPLADRPSLSVQDLSGHPMVLLDLPLSSEYFQSFFSEQGLRPNIVERTKDMAVMRSLVANGFGYSIANIRPLSDLSPDGEQLLFIPLEGQMRPMKMGLAMAKGAESTSTVKAFIEHCRGLITQKSVPGISMETQVAPGA
ncbi:LysR family transcriptional regulator [Rhodovibrionaceae bacterium A322]